MTDTRSVIALVLDMHTDGVTRELVECKCGWYCKRGPGAKDAWNTHLADELVEELLNAGLKFCNEQHWRKVTPEEEDEDSDLW